MVEKSLKKNRLDLEFHGEAQKANAFLILLTTGSLSFIGTFIWLSKSKFLYFGIITAISILIISIFFYLKSSKRMKTILNEIENLK